MKTFALVTGASRGLGEALACELIDRGIALATVARHDNPLLQERSDATGIAVSQLRADLADPAAAQQAALDLASSIPADTERCLLINNAGTVAPVANTADLTSAGTLAQAFTLNVTSLMLLCAQTLQATRGRQMDRRILNISSGAGRSPVAGWGVYCSTKAAVDMYTRVLAQEHADLRAASMAPGVIDTAMQADIRATDANAFPGKQRFLDLHEQGQLAVPATVARHIVDALLHPDFGQTILDDIRHHTS